MTTLVFQILRKRHLAKILQTSFAVAALAFAIQTQAADLRVLGGGGAQQILQSLAPKFEKATGKQVEVTIAVVGAIEQRLMAGEKTDVLLLPVQLLDRLEKAGAFRSESRTIVGQIGIGVAVREGASLPDISTVDAVRKMFLQTRSIAFPDPKLTPSGGHLIGLFAKMGIADAMQPKITFKNAIDGGINLIRDGQVETGLFLATEILPAKGVQLVGTLPASLQGYVVYGAAVAAGPGASSTATLFVKYISDVVVRDQWKAAGFELPNSGN